MSRFRHTRPTFTAEQLRIRNLVRDGGSVAVSHPVTPHMAAKALVAANIGGAQQMVGLGWALNAGARVETWDGLIRLLRAASYESAACELKLDELESGEDRDAEAAWRARYSNASIRAQDIISCASEPYHPWWTRKPFHPYSGANFVQEDDSEVVLGLGRSWICAQPEGDKVIVSVGVGHRWEEDRVEPDGWASAFKRAELAESVGVRWRRDDREAVLEALAARSVS